MTKAEVAKIVSQRTGIPNWDVSNVLNNILEVMKEGAQNGEPIFFRGFGTFSVVTRAPKKARNISKGTEILLPAHKILKFKPAKVVNKSLN